MPEETAKSPAPDVTLLLKSWPSSSYSGMKPGTEAAWTIGDSRAVPAQTAAYLRETFPEHFVLVGGGIIPALAKSAIDWLKESAGIVISEIEGGRLDDDLLVLAREEKQGKGRVTVTKAIKARLASLMGDVGDGGENA